MNFASVHLLSAGNSCSFLGCRRFLFLLLPAGNSCSFLVCMRFLFLYCLLAIPCPFLHAGSSCSFRSCWQYMFLPACWQLMSLSFLLATPIPLLFATISVHFLRAGNFYFTDNFNPFSYLVSAPVSFVPIPVSFVSCCQFLYLSCLLTIPVPFVTESHFCLFPACWNFMSFPVCWQFLFLTAS